MSAASSVRENLSQAATREHLLAAAGEVFSEVGFKAATVRQICERAGANIAAVNYHFGDKQALYRAVLKSSHQAVLANIPFNEAANRDHPAPKRLRIFIRSLLMKIFSDGPIACHGKLMAREMIEPTGALEQIVREDLGPMSCELQAIVSEIMGEKSSPAQVKLCCMSVVSQVVFYKHCRPMINLLFPEMKFDGGTIDELTGHITRFSLAAIKNFNQQQEQD